MIKKMAIAAIALSAITACNTNSSVHVNDEQIDLERGVYAKFETTKGDILVELEPEKAPMTTANFVMLTEGIMPGTSEDLAGKPFYDGLIFHRVIPDFMIQGGDPMGTGQGGPGYKFPNETSTELSHKKGVISMANSGPNTNGSQFFITVNDVQQLDGNYNVFGTVLAGQEVADSISMVPRNNSDKPEEDIVMNTVRIIRVGDYANWDAEAAFNKGREDFLAAQAEKEEAAKKAAEEARVKAEAMAIELQEKYPNAETTESGLMVVIEQVGNGAKPNDGDLVDVHYAGYLLDGKMFDTSYKALAEENNMYNPQREPYAPMQVPYGMQAQLIPGFKEGVSMLNEGGKAKLIIPPHLAYGATGAGGIIPPHAWLIFDVELVQIAK